MFKFKLDDGENNYHDFDSCNKNLLQAHCNLTFDFLKEIQLYVLFRTAYKLSVVEKKLIFNLQSFVVIYIHQTSSKHALCAGLIVQNIRYFYLEASSPRPQQLF